MVATGSVFFLRGIFFQGIFHPAIMLIGFGTLMVIYGVFAKEKIKKYFLTGIIFFCLSIIFVSSQYVVTGFRYGYVNEIGRFCFPYATALVLLYLYRSEVIWERSLTYVTLLLCLDTFYRLVLNGFTNLISADRYLIKGGGLIFMDSNFTAFFAGGILVYIFSRKLKFRKLIFINILVVIASKSYAVWIGLALVFLMQYFIRHYFNRMFIVLIWMSCIYLMNNEDIISYLYSMSSIDGSLNSKVKILTASNQIFQNTAFNSFVGVGLGNFILYADYGSHNIFGLLAELGILGYTLLLTPLFISVRFVETRLLVGYVLINSVSLLPMLYMGFFYALILFPFIRSSQKLLRDGLRKCH